MTPQSKLPFFEIIRRTARGVGFVALVFSLVVGVLLVTDWLQGGQARTVCSSELTQVLAAARQSSDSNTVTLAREMDRMERHAYFSSAAFRAVGTWMLVAGLLLLVGCLHLAARLGRRIEDPRLYPAADPVRADREARLAMLVTCAGGLLLVVIWARASRSASASTPAAPAVHASQAMAPAKVEMVVFAPKTTGAVTTYWNCFRGPGCGVADGVHAPVAWNGKSGSGVVWRAALEQQGNSAPVLWGNRVFLTQATANERTVMAWDATRGNELWRQAVADGGKGDALPQVSSDTGLDSPTAVCDESGVYAIFGTGDLAGFSPEGKLLWQVYLGRPEKSYGHASSLALDNGRIFIQYDQDPNGRLMAVDAKDGKTLWTVPRALGAVWCSPMLVPGVDGGRLLLVNGQGTLSAYDPVRGAEIWKVAGVTGEIAPSPAYWSGRVVVAMSAARMVCYQLAAKPTQLWESTESLPDVASPVAAGGLIFVPGNNELVCVDAGTGTNVWTHEYSGGFYASPLVCGGRVYALARDGVMHIVAVERTFREVATCPLGEATDATPAIADGRIYIRSAHTLWCVGSK